MFFLSAFIFLWCKFSFSECGFSVEQITSGHDNPNINVSTCKGNTQLSRAKFKTIRGYSSRKSIGSNVNWAHTRPLLYTNTYMYQSIELWIRRIYEFSCMCFTLNRTHVYPNPKCASSICDSCIWLVCFRYSIQQQYQVVITIKSIWKRTKKVYAHICISLLSSSICGSECSFEFHFSTIFVLIR